MRTVSFSNAQVQDVLNKEFVCCSTNTLGDRSAGASLAHAPTDPPGPCGRGAGRQNIQVVFLTPEGQVFHVVSGYLDSVALLDEITFAREIWMEVNEAESEAKEVVENKHQQRLDSLGYTNREIRGVGTPNFELRLKGLSPADLGFEFPKLPGLELPGGTPLPFGEDLSRLRTLKDHHYAMHHPLIPYRQFDQKVSELVGEGVSFFGSHSALNGIPEGFNQQMRRFNPSGEKK